jgi:hypothetical protein
MNANHIVIFVLVCIVLMPFFIFPMNIVSSLIVGMFFGAEACGLALLLSTLFCICIVFPLASAYYALKEEEICPWLRERQERRQRKEETRLASDPAYAAYKEKLALREAGRRIVAARQKWWVKAAFGDYAGR